MALVTTVNVLTPTLDWTSNSPILRPTISNKVNLSPADNPWAYEHTKLVIPVVAS